MAQMTGTNRQWRLVHDNLFIIYTLTFSKLHKACLPRCHLSSYMQSWSKTISKSISLEACLHRAFWNAACVCVFVTKVTVSLNMIIRDKCLKHFNAISYIEIEQGLTSHQHIIGHIGDGFLRVKWPNQQCQRTEETHKTKLNQTEQNTRIHLDQRNTDNTN